jgi:hypothetical protein
MPAAIVAPAIFKPAYFPKVICAPQLDLPKYRTTISTDRLKVKKCSGRGAAWLTPLRPEMGKFRDGL